MPSFCLNNGFQLQKTNRATTRFKQLPKKPFHHVSRDKILHDSRSISAALARGFFRPQFLTRRPWGRGCWSHIHSSQTHDACAVPAIVLQRKIQTNVESFTLTAKLNAISENLSFLLRCVQNEATGIHKFSRREILFIVTFYVSFSYELRARKSLN